MAYTKKIPANNKQGYKWLCVMEGPPDPASGVRRQISRRADTKTEATNRAQAVVDQLTAGFDLKKAKRTSFEDAANAWVEVYSATDVKASSIRLRKKTLQVLLTKISKINIDRVTHTQYQKALNELFKENAYSNSYIRSIHICANMIFEWAIKNNLRGDNPCKGITMPKNKVTVEDLENGNISEKYLERDELQEFLGEVIKHGLWGDTEMFYMLTYSGMRPGEMCALYEEDLKLKEKDVRITKTIYYPNNKNEHFQITPPKTPGSVRRFDLDDLIIDMMQKYILVKKERQARYKKLHDDFYESKFLFAKENGRPISQKLLLERMNRILKRTTITKKATPHIFRHTHVSFLAEAGVDLPTIMQRVGHDDSKTTLKVYTHVTEMMKKNSSQKRRIHFNNILNPENLQ
ncbi:tyrosine-type recombinase/integrase [Paenibacillus borealis]|uniref:Integrase n=1 Tax=Paenibacillus borealis TaxID=160799 RepID=A0A089LFT1_PAEBO|nr:site-specific integrase [Paenibacillus borealis]AIQ59732.1 integrase [Paenibacillus borealis]